MWLIEVQSRPVDRLRDFAQAVARLPQDNLPAAALNNSRRTFAVP
jgi:hypothetical protein